MGCASSNPLVEGGKNLMDDAKHATDNVIGMGEKAMHDAGDAVNTGIDTVKHTIESGIHTAQNSIGTVMNNVESTLGIAKSKAEESVTQVEDVVEEVTASAGEAIEETSSDAKTVLAFEDATNAIENEIEQAETMGAQAAIRFDALKDEFGETVEAAETRLEETLHVEDIEEPPDASGGAESPGVEALRQPTSWEAAADAVHNWRVRVAVVDALTERADVGGEGDNGGGYVESSSDATHASSFSTSVATSTTSTMSTSSGAFASASHGASATHTSDVYDASTTTHTASSKDLHSGNATSDILLSDSISLKSYKSEISS